MATDATSMMPFITTYWPHLLAGLFVYVLTYLFFDRSRSSGDKTETENRDQTRTEEVRTKKRREDCDEDSCEDSEDQVKSLKRSNNNFFSIAELKAETFK
jgi:hypothetical protein